MSERRAPTPDPEGSVRPEPATITSRLSGFHRQTVEERLSRIFESGLLSEGSRWHLRGGGALDVSVADRLSENVIATQALPFSVALNFRVNQRDVLVPMAVEEPSIVAAASNAARLIRPSGGFVGEADRSVMTAQVQLDDVPDAVAAKARLEAARDELCAAANRAIPRMVERGGGVEDLEVRVLDPEHGVLVVHFYVDVGNAMGANLVDTVAEAIAPEVQRLAGGRIGLRILSNLPLRRMVRVSARVGAEALGGEELADGIARASRFAELDPFRAVTHNKGVMNGIDAVAVALGQDWRSIEAGAHAYAALAGAYRPLATWTRTESGLEGRLTMPLAVATAGGSTRAHRGVEAAFELVAARDARELAVIMGAAGLACNLAALRALAGEGIQKGHMRLHRRKEAERDEARKEHGR
jgi:hydroxymethylglutaryl-CoA reductase